MMAYGRVEVQLHVFLIPALHGSDWSASYPGYFTSKERAKSTLCRGHWMGLRARLDVLDKRKSLGHGLVTTLTEL
jgi:hypothetical protein